MSSLIPEVSVIVPLFNKEGTLLRCLNSITTQSFQDFELIVVDDGSTDGSLKKARVYADQISHRQPVQVITQTNRGPGAARNEGARRASGKYLAFLDADDEWSEDYLSRCVESFRAQPGAATVSCGFSDLPRPYKPSGPNSPERAEQAFRDFWVGRGVREGFQRADPTWTVSRMVHSLAFMSPCSTAVRSDHFWRHGGFYAKAGGLYGEDAYLFFKILCAEEVCFSFDQLVNFYRDASGLSGNLKGVRPVEPFLLDPDDFAEGLPSAMRPLATRVLALRAAKTACVLGYWGEWRSAKELLRRFRLMKVLQSRYGLPALVASNRLGSLLSPIVRTVHMHRKARSHHANVRSEPLDELRSSVAGTSISGGTRSR